MVSKDHLKLSLFIPLIPLLILRNRLQIDKILKFSLCKMDLRLFFDKLS